jgi:hypothetical protein
MKYQWLICASLAFGMSVCSASTTKASGPYRVVASSGQLSGVGNSTFDSFFWGASFDSAERINVRAETTGPTNTLFLIDQSGSLTPALLSTGAAPGFPVGATIQGFGKFGPIAQNGYATAIGSVTGGGLTGNNSGLFASGPDGTFHLAERSGQLAFNMPGVTVLPQGLDTLSKSRRRPSRTRPVYRWSIFRRGQVSNMARAWARPGVGVLRRNAGAWFPDWRRVADHRLVQVWDRDRR